MSETNIIKPRRALISVSNKSGIVDFAKRLISCDVEIISTTGTAQILRDAGLTVTEVADYTQFPEIMGGHVKTLHPLIYGGILARRGIDDNDIMMYNIATIDLVVVNFHPFNETIAKDSTSIEATMENIDIGGPAMLRAAAKNHHTVTAIAHPIDYPQIIYSIENGGIPLELRQQLAVKAFAYTADYDRTISQYLSDNYQIKAEDFPKQITFNYQLVDVLPYGESPYQCAAFYQDVQPIGNSLVNAKQHQGEPLSYNNIADADVALRTTLLFPEDATCVIVKHANPCGVACAENIYQAYNLAYNTDATSAFGGVIAFNRAIDDKTAAEIISRQYVEVLLAPSFSCDALEVFAQKPNICVLEIHSDGHDIAQWQIQSVRGGILLQDWDNNCAIMNDFQVVSHREPTHDELRDLLFSWHVVRSVKSNAIVIARDNATLSIDIGQISRIYPTKIAIMKAQDPQLNMQGAVLASDDFLPLSESIMAIAQVGISAIIQPGGSIRDQEVIQAANNANIAMLFYRNTGLPPLNNNA